MKIDDIARQDFSELGLEMYQFVSDLYPICRSITGNGLRETIRRVKQHIPLEMREAATGERVFDWTIPKEWNIRNAYVKNSKGEKIIDFQRSNLHILNYSTPIHAKMSLAELRSHLFSNPEHPDWIPYRTSYYKESWGFCISDKQRVSL
jgi:aminopeptidase-like protein